MALKHMNQNRFSYDTVLSIDKFALAERRLKDKRQALADMQYELSLIERDAFITYQQEVSYDMYFSEYVVTKAKKWYEMLNSKDVKIDRRKKYDEQANFQYLEQSLKKLFNREDIKITEFIMCGYEHSGDAIYFECGGHKFSLQVPVLRNIPLAEYIRCGAEVFKLSLHNHDQSCISEWMGATFFEEDLQNILQTYFDKQGGET
jgi:hypothetical protein